MLLEKGETAMGRQNMAEVQGIRVSADVDRWVMSRAHPEKWGDRLEVTHVPKTYELPAGHELGFADSKAFVIEGIGGTTIAIPDNSRFGRGDDALAGATALEEGGIDEASAAGSCSLNLQCVRAKSMVCGHAGRPPDCV
jgi:hypothetical protein